MRGYGSPTRDTQHTEQPMIAIIPHDSFQLPSIRYLFASAGRCQARVRSSILAGAAASDSLGPPQSEYQEFRCYLDETRGRG